jgi:diguanylate cyclase (GGDEF)-like protein/PAS domain S-box-containing protein
MNCIHLIIHHKENRQLLKTWLADRYQVIETESFEMLNQDCALVIVDAVTLSRHETDINHFKKLQPFVPIILITPLEGVGLATRQLWKTVDELIISPIKKIEMLARVHGLMQTRELHLRLQRQNEELLQRSEERYRNLFENNHIVMLIIDPDSGAIVAANPAASDYYGWTQQQLQCMNIFQLDTHSLSNDHTQILLTRLQQRQCFELQHRLADSSIRDVEIFSGPIPVGDRCLLYAFVHDITKRKQAVTELRIAATVFESIEGMLVTDADNNILKVNHTFTHITGYTAEEVIGKNPRILQSGRHDALFFVAMWKSINMGAWEGEIWNRRKNGEIYPEHLTITAVKAQDGSITNYVAIFADITPVKAAAAEIEYLAFYDPLTCLPNRRLLHDRLKSALASSHRSGKKCALLFIDMDNFKGLNDTLGHDIGDLLLQQVAQRLKSNVREGDTVARLGGDEFVVMLEDLSELDLEALAQAEMIGNKVLATLNQSYQLHTHTYFSTASIGATLFTGHEQSAEEQLKKVDIAMYQAKAAGRNALRFFDPNMQSNINARAALEADLRRAVTEKQFVLYYQSQVHRNRQIVGAEVLIRWQHPLRGFVSPADFIPLAEETGLILPIGKWVLETACTQLKRWEKTTLPPNFQLSINVSAHQFHQTDFVAEVCQILHRSAINPNQLKLELTESIVISNIDDTILKMKALREMGVRFSMDDFGTGYSSLSSLKKLPLDQLKIDQSFVRDLSIDQDDAVIVKTIITMAKNLGIDVIAEGVETEAQRAFLDRHGCPVCQGYLFSKPVPLAEFEQLLKGNLDVR